MAAESAQRSRRPLLVGLALALALSWAAGLYLLLSGDDSAGGPAVGSADPKSNSVLFVQKGRSGTLEPLAGRRDAYRLTVDGIDPRVAFFSDRPARLAGSIDNQALLEALFDLPGDPPNAALAMEVPGQHEQAILPVELSDPALDRGGARVSYRATRLDAPSEDLAYLAYSDPVDTPRRFGAVDLFIDSGDYPNVCQTTLHTRNEPLFLKSADPAVGDSHYGTLEPSINADSEGRIILDYNAEKGLFEDEGGFHADLIYEYEGDGTSIHVHPHCNFDGIYLRDTECTITAPDGSESACRHESGPDGQGGRLIDYFLY